MNRFLKSAAFPILVVILLAYFAQQLILSKGDSAQSVGWSGFVQRLDQKNPGIAKLKIDPTKNSITYQLSDAKGTKYTTGYPGDIQLSSAVNKAEKDNVLVEVTTKGGSPWWSLLTYLLPFVLFLGLWVFLMNQMQGGGSKVMSFGKSRAKRMSVDSPKITFKDVAGVDEAVEELHEIKEFLENPKKFQALGARIPKGVLLYGPPGTGKTLLARAVAGEAGVPFFSISGSDFVEMFVGVGASRVRDLFEQGKAHAPCIIFIDEIDAVGRHRGAGLGGGHDEREQTLNQLLVEMDGFESNEGVILLAATNRPDILDPALLRPGRFDRQIVVDMPDLKGREQILRVHVRKIPMAPGVNLERIARGTPGLAGAELANIVNEAALLAARRNKAQVDGQDFEDAKDKVMLGLERKSRVLSDEERRLVAYHEAGHALVGLTVPDADPLHKVTIIPRGRALGLTAYLPEEELHKYTKRSIESRLAMAYGGRVAEELVFGPEKVTTGAAQDIQQATNIARRMVTQFGMSAVIGPIAVGDREQEIFLGREVVQRREISDRTAQIVDEEVKNILTRAYAEAARIVLERRAALDRLAAALLERETLEREQVEMVIAGQPLPPYVPPPAPPARVESGEQEKEKPSQRTSGGILRNPPPEPAGA